MRAWKLVVVAGIVGILTSLCLAQAPPSPAAAAPAPATPPALLPSVKAIQDATTAAAAADAYSQGCQVDRNSIDLNRAYMRRVLQLGQPQTAGTPALTLVSVGANDGTAYGVMAYNSGKTNELAKALSYSIKAATIVKDDNSIENNLGQLVGWYDGAKTCKLPDDERQALTKLEANLASCPAYATAYKTIKDAYDKQADANQQNQQKITAAQADVTAAQKKVTDAQAEVTRITQDITAQQAKAKAAQPPPPPPPPRGGRPAPAPKVDTAALAAANKAIADDNAKLTTANKTLTDDKATLAQKTGALDAARAASSKVEPVPLAKLFVWLPPAVDGVVTMPADAAPKAASAPAGTP